MKIKIIFKPILNIWSNLCLQLVKQKKFTL